MFTDRALDGVVIIVVMTSTIMMMTMMMMMIAVMIMMSECLVILPHHERYISTVNCDFQSVLTDRALDKNAER